ncbi:anti-sigma-F factor Fin [Lentibacillus juripiscarius]|uniref:Anti-sigma-F factor Fin n=1 Tax=Lentibacillus juripiscarius TaxID=257446 RepID=A0ABW5V7I6_9BACI
MPIIYQCRHCGHKIGQLDQQMVDASMLGLDQLSVEDRQDMVNYQENGDIQIKSICESCEESLGKNPQYHELDHFIQ